MIYTSKKEAEKAGPQDGSVRVGHRSYYWRECLICHEVKLIGNTNKYCSNLCDRRARRLGDEYHSKIRYERSEVSAADYEKFHKRVRVVRGKASKCIFGCKEGPFHWANQTGKYGDIDDYQPMCAWHHKQLDLGRL